MQQKRRELELEEKEKVLVVKREQLEKERLQLINEVSFYHLLVRDFYENRFLLF